MAIASIGTALLAPSAFAGPGNSCPAGQGWGAWPIEAAAERIWPSLVDTSIFPNGIGDLEDALHGYDANGDGLVCLKIMWGDDLNPISHWYKVGLELLGSPVEQFLPRDNNANA